MRLLVFVVFCFFGTAGTAPALTVAAEGRVRVVDGEWVRSRQAALGAALRRAVQVVLERHVPAEELRRRAREVDAAFLSRASNHVVRWAISSETQVSGSLRISTEVDVDREKLLEQVRDLGFTVLQLVTAPRILVLPAGAAEVTSAGRALRGVLESEGFRTRVFPVDPGIAGNEASVSEWARGLGCHVVFVVRVGEMAASPPDLPQDEGLGLGWLGPDDRVRVGVTGRGWVVDARGERTLGRTEAVAEGEGSGPVDAAAAAATRAGRELAYPMLALLEQSGWTPGVEARALAVQVEGLVEPALVEELGAELAVVTEVRRVELRELGYRSAVWRVEAVDSGLAWDTILASIRLRRGRLAWRGGGLALGDGTPEVVRMEWVDR